MKKVLLSLLLLGVLAAGAVVGWGVLRERRVQTFADLPVTLPAPSGLATQHFRKWVSTILTTMFTFLSRSQLCTSSNTSACGSLRPRTLTWSAISRKLCSRRAVLLACAQNTHVSGDCSAVR